EVGLLADVDQHRDHLVVAVVLLQPRDRAARVEPARVGEDSGLAHVSPSRWWRNSRSSAAPVAPSRAMTMIVLSPAIVPSTSGRRAWSIAWASAFAWPGGVWTTRRFADGASEIAQRRSADVGSLSRSRSAPPGSAYTSRPDESRTLTSPSCAMSRETVACTA